MDITPNAVYTFEFHWQDADNVTQKRVRRVPIAELWDKFDLACEWRRNSKPSQVRTASVYGPGIMRRTCHEMSRDHLRETLEPLGLIPFEPCYVGLVWASLAGSDGYHLYKVRQETAELDGFERPYVTQNALEMVDDEKVDTAFYWAMEKCWHPFPTWLNDRPAIAYCGDHSKCERAMANIGDIAPQLYDRRLIRSSVRFDWRGKEFRPYPYMKPTRLRTRIQDLRSRYPNASEDMAVVPRIVLERDYGRGLPTGISHTPAFAG